MIGNLLDSLQIKGEDMIEVAEVQPEGRACTHEPCSDILSGWRGMRSTFGPTTLYEIIAPHISIL